MRGARGPLVVMAAVGALLLPGAGAAAEEDAEERRQKQVSGSSWPRGVHPWPRGDEWPEGLAGPFEKLPPEALALPMDDGVVLRGALWRPVVPLGVQVPVVLTASAYLGNLDATADDPRDGDVSSFPSPDASVTLRPRPVPVDRLVRQGYAVALISVRGTGESGGCFDYHGAWQQRDHARLVSWLAARDWSNGRIAMMGVSYDGTTALEAAVQDLPALKTVVPMAAAIDYYVGGVATPQGAMKALFAAGNEPANTAATGMPPVNRTGTGQPGSTARFVGQPGSSPLVQRACADALVHWSRSAQEPFVDERDAAYYLPRRLTHRLGAVTAAVLGVMPLHETSYENYGFDAVGWELLDRAPKHLVLGQWNHCDARFVPDWAGRLDRWLAFWLKGLGDPPAQLGTVEYQVDDDGVTLDCTGSEDAAAGGAWATASAWPPRSTGIEALLAGAGRLGAGAAAGHDVLRARPVTRQDTLVCSQRDDAVTFLGAPLTQDLVLTGSPLAVLELSSDASAGLLDLRLYAVDDTCSTVRFLTAGAADLRFFADQFLAQPVTPGQPFRMRVDLANVAVQVPAGWRLALLATGGDPGDRNGPPVFPRLRFVSGIAGGSQLLLPVTAGTAGGTAPRGPIPARPDVPGQETPGRL